MVRGEVDPTTVTKIVGGTRAANPEAWDVIIKSYKSTFWHDFPDQAEKLVRQFIAEGKIEQPRLTGNTWPRIDGKKIFVESEAEINLKGW